jgi:hypothetical protein
MGIVSSNVGKWGHGQIEDPYKDLDFWKFTIPANGSVSIYLAWMGGSHFTDGNERDLHFGLYDSSYSLVASGNFEYAGYSYFAYRVIRADLSAGTYYLRVSVFQNDNTSLYRNETYNIQLNYKSVPLSSITMARLPKINYLPGEVFDSTGGIINASYSDGSKQMHTLTNSMISGYNRFASYGPQTVFVNYGGKTTSFVVYTVRFSDVPYNHRSFAHINTLVDLGIINGYNDNTFRPNNTLTRAQAAIMIARAIGLSTEGVSSNFSDVPSTHSAYKFISAAEKAGIINGYNDGTFRPNAPITRAQIAVMIQRAFQVQTSGTQMSFTDVPEGYAPKKFIEILASQKIVNGYSDGTFKPLNNVTQSSVLYDDLQCDSICSEG